MNLQEKEQWYTHKYPSHHLSGTSKHWEACEQIKYQTVYVIKRKGSLCTAGSVSTKTGTLHSETENLSPSSEKNFNIQLKVAGAFQNLKSKKKKFNSCKKHTQKCVVLDKLTLKTKNPNLFS